MNIKKKPIFYTELSYVIGLALTAVATALMTVADFGLSMIAAPAYLLHLKISEYLPFFSFGMASYAFQALLLTVMMILVRRFRISYFFSFVTGVLYGLLLDLSMLFVVFIPADHIAVRVVLFAAGLICCAVGVALMFRTYISPAAYELFVKEVAKRFNLPVARFKIFYDCASCALAILLSFVFFGLFQFRGVNVGTVVCALLNGVLIAAFGRWFDKHFTFQDRFALAHWFEK